MLSCQCKREVQNLVVEGNADPSINALSLLIGSRPAPVQDVGSTWHPKPYLDPLTCFLHSEDVCRLHQIATWPVKLHFALSVRAIADAPHKSRERVHERLPEETREIPGSFRLTKITAHGTELIGGVSLPQETLDKEEAENKRWRRESSLTVAIMGTDAAGKSLENPACSPAPQR